MFHRHVQVQYCERVVLVSMKDIEQYYQPILLQHHCQYRQYHPRFTSGDLGSTDSPRMAAIVRATRLLGDAPVRNSAEPADGDDSDSDGIEDLYRCYGTMFSMYHVYLVMLIYMHTCMQLHACIPLHYITLPYITIYYHTYIHNHT